MNPCQFDGARRGFLKKSASVAALYFTPSVLVKTFAADSLVPMPIAKEKLKFILNGKSVAVEIDARTTMLNLLREQIGYTGTKKGCEMGQCGACTIHVNGKRLKSCTQLALNHQNNQITTIEGLAKGDQLHPMQAAFLKNDAFQCGYCTSCESCPAPLCISLVVNPNSFEALKMTCCKTLLVNAGLEALACNSNMIFTLDSFAIIAARFSICAKSISILSSDKSRISKPSNT
jgi:xanthine dehydrogenase YagT iron-sulfur-binding subunit